ncbi:hypothetical protein OMCYN_01378 [cyanobiont of Ornithocercus magnificus]|nr:hypothetical protein OMCYN_01378 [cyanobiont of Ornithocercus magnificus]
MVISQAQYTIELLGARKPLQSMRLSLVLRDLSAVDVLATTIALMALVGVIWSPKLSNTIAQGTSKSKSVEVSVDVRRLASADPNGLIRSALEEGQTQIVIRNAPAGFIRLVDIKVLERQLVAVQPDGSLVITTAPSRPEIDGLNARFVLQGNAVVADTGVIIGNTSLKIGTPIELEGRMYRVNGIVSGLAIR